VSGQAQEAAAKALDVVEAAANAIAHGRRGVESMAGRLVAAGARLGSRLLRSGLSVDEAVQEIDRIRPHRAEKIDGRVDKLVEEMPGEGG